jgi:hypothetical protein
MITEKNQSSKPTPWEKPEITTLSISRDTRQLPLDPPGEGQQS